MTETGFPTPFPAPPKPGGPRVAVMDSGVGGLSVVPALIQVVPQAELLVVADSGFAPYGERDESWLQRRCADLAAWVRAQSADLLVLACNSATAAAADGLRQEHPGWPIVGIEPGIKPAAARSQAGRIGVMATEATLRSDRYARLLAQHGQGLEVVAQPCSGLAWAIERGDAALIDQLVARHTEPLRARGVDVVVLGCTHYPFVREQIQRAMGSAVELIDTSEAVARRAGALLAELGWGTQPAGSSPPAAQYWTSGSPDELNAFARRWLDRQISARPLLVPASEPAPTAADPR